MNSADMHALLEKGPFLIVHAYLHSFMNSADMHALLEMGPFGIKPQRFGAI